MTGPCQRAGIDVPRETMERLELFVDLLREENKRQNLVSAESLDQVWERHVLDSAQLARLASPDASTWIDLGTGAGFPGLIVALFHPARMTLVEARPLRSEFLAQACGRLGIGDKVTVLAAKAEAVAARPYDVISARACAPLTRLFGLGARFAAPETLWVLPKGKNAKAELEAAESSWQGSFRLEPSLTDADARIVVADRVRRRDGGKGRR